MRTLKHNSLGVLALAVGLAMALVMLGAGCSDGKKEASVKFAACPAAVQKTISEHANGLVFAEVKQETKQDGRIIFEAKGKKADGGKIEIKVANDGHLLEFKNEDKE